MVFKIQRVFNNARVVVFGLALVAVAGAWTYELMYALPKERCERGGGIWAGRWRACGREVTLQSLTGRPTPGHPAQAASQPQAAPAPAQGH